MEFAETNNFAVQSPLTGNSESGEIDASVLMDSHESGGDPAETVDSGSTTQPNNPPERTFTQDEMNKAISKRLREERKSAEYSLGNELLRETMQEHNLSKQDALKKIREDRLKAKATEYKDNPEKGFEAILRGRNHDYEESVETLSTQSKAEQIAKELMQEVEEGRIPRDFNLSAYMSNPESARSFLRHRELLGVEEAVQIARMNESNHRQYNSEDKAAKNKSLPKPIGTNNSYKPTIPDYTSMSTEEFKKAAAKIREAHKSGKRVIL